MTKRIKYNLTVAITAALLASSLQANAFTTSVTGGPTSFQAGALNINFGTGVATNAGPVAGAGSGADLIFSGSGGGVSYDYHGGALYNLATSPISGVTARPVGSVGNFHSVGTSPTAQTGPADVQFSSGLSYFGFLWGSPDAYNTVNFYNGQSLLGSFTGAAVLMPPNGDQTFSAYFNAFAGPNEQITRVTFSSTNNALETDNHAYIAAIPEPETYAMMLAGLGLLGFAARRRKLKEAAAA